MLKAPLWISAALLALTCLAGPAQAAAGAPPPLLPDVIAATAVEPVRFEARGGKSQRAGRHARRGRGQTCRRCGRGEENVAVLAIAPRNRALPSEPPSPPPRSTVRMTTDTLGPLRLRLYSSTWVERCEQKHPSFIARTGTYEGEGGKRERCE